MKRFFTALVCSASLFAIAQVQGVKIETVGHIPLEQFPGNPTQISDIWGYTDADGRKYALVTKANGITIYDITTPESPVEISDFELTANQWKDVKTYVYEDGRAYAFVTADNASGVGLTVIDMSNLPESATLVDKFPLFEEAHNIFVDPDHESPYAYIAITAGDAEAGLMIIDISDPENPTKVSHMQEGFGVHDLYVSKNWANPEWNGKELGILFSEGAGIVVVDLADKANPVILSQTRYEGLAYSHSGWADKTGRYIYAFDEIDEMVYGHRTKVRTFDFFDPTAPVLVDTWEGLDNDIDHNGIVKGDRLYISHYTAGLTILDISNPADPQLAGQSYPFPKEEAPTMNGYWGVYPLFDDDLVVCSDITNGLVVLRVTDIDEPNVVYGPRKLEVCAETDTANQVAVSLFAPDAIDLPLSVVEAPEGVNISFPKATISSGETLQVDIAPTVTLPVAEYDIILAAGEHQMPITLSLIGRDANLDLLMPVNGETTVSRNGGFLFWRFSQEAELYNITFWTQPDRSDLVAIPYGRNFLNLRGALLPNTTYYWQVVAQGKCDIVTSEVQSFTTDGPRVLFVDDTGGDFLEPRLWSTMANLNGIRADFRSPETPDFLSGIEDYDAIFWFSGMNRDHAGPTTDEEALLATYLDNGGKLIMGAPGYYQARGNTTDGFLADRLGVSAVGDTAELTNLVGAGLMADMPPSTIRAGYTSDQLTASVGASAVLNDSENGHVVGVATENTLYLSVPLAAFDNMFSYGDILEAFYLEHMTLERTSGIYQKYVPINPFLTNVAARLYLYNKSESVANVTVEAVDSAGRVISRSRPSILGLGMTTQRLFEITGVVNMEFSYLVLHSDQPFEAMIEGYNVARGYALPASDSISTTLHVPHVAADTNSFFTLASVANVMGEDMQPTFNTSDDASWNLDFNTGYAASLFSFSDLMTDITPERTRGSFQAALPGLIGAEVFGANDHLQMAGLRLSDQTSNALYFNHIANTDADWWTGLTAYNPGTEPASIAGIVYDAEGNTAATGVIQIAPGERLIDAVTSSSRGEDFFPNGIPSNGAWVKLDSDQPLVGYTLFSDSENRLFAGLEANTQAYTDQILPFVGDQDRYAGIAFVNDTDAEQDVQLTLRNGTGIFQGSVVVTVPAHGRVTKTGSDLFGSAIMYQNTYAQVSSENGVHAFVIYGDHGSNWLSGLNALPGTSQD